MGLTGGPHSRATYRIHWFVSTEKEDTMSIPEEQVLFILNTVGRMFTGRAKALSAKAKKEVLETGDVSEETIEAMRQLIREEEY